MKRFGIDEKVAKVEAKMKEFFVAHGIEDTFELRVNSSSVTQKVEEAVKWIEGETQRTIDNAPVVCRDEVKSMVADFDGFPVDMFRSNFKSLLKLKLYTVLNALTVTAEKLDPEGGYDKVINMSMEDVVKVLTTDEDIDEFIDATKKIAMQTFLKTMSKAARFKRTPTVLRVLRKCGLLPSDIEISEDYDGHIAGQKFLISYFEKVFGDIDDSTDEEDEEKGESKK